MTASGTVLGILLGYLVILIAIGAWGSRASKDVAGYFVAGKSLPPWVIAFSSNATGESAWLLLGLTGIGYLVGVHALWIVLGEVVGVTLAWLFIARPFKAYTDHFDSITVPDYLADRFRDRTHLLRVLSALSIFSMATFYTAAQLTASGKAFESFLSTSYEGGVLIGAVIILFYTSVGGFKAVAYSDLLQGVLMLVCLILLPIVGVAAAGGFGEMTATLRADDPALLQPMGAAGLTPVGLAGVLGFIGIGWAFLGSPQLLTRFISARDQKALVRAGPVAIACIVIFGVGAVLAGMAGRAVFPSLSDHELIYATMGAELFPEIFTGVFLVIVLAAMMSTVDSLLILASSAVVRDVVQKIFDPGWPQRALSTLGKGVTVVLGAGAVSLALQEARVIFWFVLFAWSGLASAFAPVVLCSLFWKRTTRAGAVAGMAAGFVTCVIWAAWLKPYVLDLYEMVPGFAVGFAVTIGVSLCTTPPDGAAELHDAISARTR